MGSHLAQDNVDAVRAAGVALGLDPTAQNAYAEIDNPNAFSEPTIQFYPNRVETDDPAVSFYATAKKAQAAGSASTSIGSTAGSQGDGRVTWDFGDGTVETHSNQTRFTHTFPGPGAYRVQASVTDNLGKTYRWTQTSDRHAAVGGRRPGHGGRQCRPYRPRRRRAALRRHCRPLDVPGRHDGRGHDGDRAGRADQATVAITDGAGNTATVTVPVA